MIYVKCDKTGLSVESVDPSRYCDATTEEITVRFTVLSQEDGKPFVKAASLLTSAEADALLRGLLRRKLETANRERSFYGLAADDVDEFCRSLIDEWESEQAGALHRGEGR